jgi:hypothetical protein
MIFLRCFWRILGENSGIGGFLFCLLDAQKGIKNGNASKTKDHRLKNKG